MHETTCPRASTPHWEGMPGQGDALPPPAVVHATLAPALMSQAARMRRHAMLPILLHTRTPMASEPSNINNTQCHTFWRHDHTKPISAQSPTATPLHLHMHSYHTTTSA